MRQKRAKAYRKLMHVYSISFGFRQPYQVLVDSEMCKSALGQNLNLVKQLYSVLQGEVKPMITQCCIHELYLQGKQQQPSVDLAKNFERRMCNHREAIPGDECLLSTVGDKNKHRYVVATQSHPLRAKLRAIPGTPIVHINRSVMILEPPSDATLKAKEMNEHQKLHATAVDLVLVDPPTSKDLKKRRGPKGPNPLSMKKKKINEVPLHANSSMTANNERDAKVSLGLKRKADFSEEDGVKDEDVIQQTSNSNPKVRRRKRRKNHTNEDTAHLAS